MAQFSVHRNANPATREAVPFLLDVQADLLAGLATRVVVPLYGAAVLRRAAVKTLMPVFKVAGRSVVMATPELAGVPKKALGPVVADLAAERAAILAALDLLIAGI
ncbi:MAG: CcdB family protein [Holophagaceae bacterium]